MNFPLMAWQNLENECYLNDTTKLNNINTKLKESETNRN